MLNEQKKKETISYLRNVRSQVDSIIAIIEKEDIEMAYLMLRAWLALVAKLCDEDFIHLLRDDTGDRLENLGEHPDLKPEDFAQLEKIYNGRTSLTFEEFASLYKLMRKIKDSLS